MSIHTPGKILSAVDDWYWRQARELPWRISPKARAAGERPDPYRVWLSEIMLQQTTIAHAAPYFQQFIARWPGVRQLAAADWQAVSAAWAGLGYYSRVRNLHACAQIVADAGGFPQDRAGLLSLPGVGPYTAAAIAAIAFEERAAPVDGNIERVMSRLGAIGSDATEPGWRAAKKFISAQAQALFDAIPDGMSPGNIAQALMDLGATVCTPRRPACNVCPLLHLCAARQAGDPDRYPVKPAKKPLPVRFGAAYVLLRGGEVLLVRRPPEGLLGGMMMPPTSAWLDAKVDALAAAPFDAEWRPVGEVRHVFTHFALTLDVWRAEAPARARVSGEWLAVEDALMALPTVGRKAVALAVAERRTP